VRRGWFVLLALSLGLNVGLLYTTLADAARRREPVPLAPFVGAPPRPIDGPPGAEPGLEPHCPALCEPMMRRRLGGLASRLDLDEGQQETLGGILRQAYPQILALRESVAAARRTLQVAYARPMIEPGAIRRLTQEINLAQARLDSLVAETMLREASVLTADQRARYFQRMRWGQDSGRSRADRRRARDAAGP